jgi:uncharacterized protein (DUF697 family)
VLFFLEAAGADAFCPGMGKSEEALLEAAKALVEIASDIVDDAAPKEIVEIIKTHAVGAAAAGVASGWIPGAGGTIASVAAAGFVWTMYGRINARINLPMSENLLKSIATGVLTNLGAYMVGTVAISALVSFVPGIGSFAASVAVGSISFALTVGSGLVYMKVLHAFFASGQDPTKMSSDALKAAADGVISRESASIREVMNSARSDYKASEGK